MTANELPADQLADLLDEIPVGDFESLDHHHFTRQAATMLRQQQAEIESLKQIIDANNLNQNIGQFVKPANEPYLTDEKIWKLWQTHLNDEITVFAKALIKEASEK